MALRLAALSGHTAVRRLHRGPHGRRASARSHTRGNRGGTGSRRRRECGRHAGFFIARDGCGGSKNRIRDAAGGVSIPPQSAAASVVRR